MKYINHKEQRYKYCCDNCGNTFSKNYHCEPNYCRECRNYGTFHEEIEGIDEIHQYCPMCKQYFKTSDYLNEIFLNDEKPRWLANMVTHYRHDHLTSWDSTWNRRSGYGSKFLSEATYENEKKKVNERAKRQILRMCKDYLIENGFGVDDIIKLHNSDPKTIDLYKKILCSKRNVA